MKETKSTVIGLPPFPKEQRKRCKSYEDSASVPRGILRLVPEREKQQKTLIPTTVEYGKWLIPLIIQAQNLQEWVHMMLIGHELEIKVR